MKGVAAESDVTVPVPEESLPQIAEPKEAEAIVAAVIELGAVDHELEIERLIEVGRERQRALNADVKAIVAAADCTSSWEDMPDIDRLKLEIERLIEVGRERQRALKQLDGDVESIFERLGELESGEAKAAAAEVLERRLGNIEGDLVERKYWQDTNGVRMWEKIEKMWLMTDEGKQEQQEAMEEHCGPWRRRRKAATTTTTEEAERAERVRKEAEWAEEQERQIQEIERWKREHYGLA